MITIEPNNSVETVVSLPICFSASAIVVIPQEDTRRPDFAPSGTNWTYDSVDGIWQRVSGTNGLAVAPAYVDTLIYGKQPFFFRGTIWEFTTPGVPNKNYHCFLGVYDDGGTFYGWEVVRYCGNNNSCDGTNNGQWIASVRIGGSIVLQRNVNFKENFRVRSNGVTLYFEHQQGSVWLLDYQITLPITDTFQMHVNSMWNNNKWSFLQSFKGTYQGEVPVTWSTPLGGTLTGTGNTRCFESAIVGTYQVCVDSEFDDPVCVDVDVAALYFQPLDVNCDDCVLANSIVEFESNAGLSGVLTADGGTVIDSLTWQAPSSPGSYELTYTLGLDSVVCDIHVVEDIVLTNVVGDTIRGLIPGDTFQILTNYDIEEVIWRNVDCPNIVQENGIIVIPKDRNDGCFGKLDCYIEGELQVKPCSNLEVSPVTKRLRIVVDPVYPTPEFGGAVPIKYKPETPEYKGLVKEMEGGCDETHIRNTEPIRRWTIRYDGLRYDGHVCDDKPCCHEDMGYVGGYDASFQSVKRIDDFWNLVFGQYGYFTFKDYRTGEVYHNARFEERIGVDHINWRTTQSRDVSIIWKPCCEKRTQRCPHFTILTDVTEPTVPTGLTEYINDGYKIAVIWNASIDDIGIAGYEISVDGQIYDVGNKLVYSHLVAPESSHTYKVRAYDFSNNKSAWSGEVVVSAPFIDTIPPSIPANFTATPYSLYAVELEWDIATDNVKVGGYQLYVNNLVIDVGNVTSYIHNVPVNSSQTYYIRAYDEAGNHSPWSSGVVGQPVYDTTNPTIEIISPGNNDTISGEWAVNVVANDDTGVIAVSYFRNGDYLGEVYVSPFTFNWDTTETLDGTYLLTAIAYDGVLNDASDAIVVHIDNTGTLYEDIEEGGIQVQEMGDNIVDN